MSTVEHIKRENGGTRASGGLLMSTANGAREKKKQRGKKRERKIYKGLWKLPNARARLKAWNRRRGECLKRGERL